MQHFLSIYTILKTKMKDKQNMNRNFSPIFYYYYYQKQQRKKKE